MTDRAKKISELQTTSTVANTDKIVVLKDAANTSAASTRAMTVNAFAQSITALVQAPIVNSAAVSNSVTIPSNGTTPVAFFNYNVAFGRSGCCDILVNAVDTTTNTVTIGKMLIAILGSQANINYTSTCELGTNPIKFDVVPAVNTISNNVTLYLRRESAASSDVNVRFIATLL